MNLIQLCEFVDIEIICCSAFALLLDPLWKMPYHFFKFLVLVCENCADCSNLATSAGKNIIN